MEVGKTYKRGEDAAAYWEWQSEIGAIGGRLNVRKFAPYIDPEDSVLDFGCCGGFLLEHLPGRQKIGIEPLEPARERAISVGLHVVSNARELEDASVDVIVSNHALEHVVEPVAELRGLRRVLRPGGKIVLVVPINDWRSERRRNPDDPNHHSLYVDSAVDREPA